MKAKDIEIAVSKYFGPRKNIILPNISWGIGLKHECDLLIVTKSGYAYEVEIKVSRQDLLKDLKKPHKHEHFKLKKLFFAIPEYLKKDIESIPECAGILIIDENMRVELIRKAKTKGNYKFNETDFFNLARLGGLRVLNLNKKLNKGQNYA